MSEAEWQAGTDLRSMLRQLPALTGQQHRPWRRKLRLFAVACCRRSPFWLADARMRAAVEAAERYADGLATPEDLDAAYTPAHLAQLTGSVVAHRGASSWVAEEVSHPRHFTPGEPPYSALCRLLREIVGNPYRPAPSCRDWVGRDAGRVARAAYDGRHADSGEMDPLALGALADALEEAGCPDAELIAHLREPGPHHRGCWAVDNVLGLS
jgi:hypothetical protein